MIQLHRLEGFYRVATASGYARAARTFPYPITQPGVHAQVRRLEQELGAKLFQQVSKDSLVPTRAGRRLLDFCTPFFEQLSEVVEQVQRGGAAGRVRVEAGPLEIQEILPAWLRRVSLEHPEIEIELREIDSPKPERLLDGSVDLIVDYQPSVPHGIATRTVATHHAFLVVPAEHAKVRRGRARVADFMREPFVALQIGPQRALQLGALHTVRAEPQRITSAPSVTSVLAFVAAGLGYSLIPWPARRGPRVPGVLATALPGRGTTFSVSASWRASRESDPALEAVLALAPQSGTSDSGVTRRKRNRRSPELVRLRRR